MRDELNLIELVDRYLSGAMDTTESAAFEARIGKSAELQALVEDQRALRGGMERLALRPMVNKAYRNYKLGKWAPGIGGALIMVLLAAGAWLWMDHNDQIISPQERSHINEHSELVQLSDTAGTGLPALVMIIDPKADTTLITPNGLVVDIPEGAFLDGQGKRIDAPVRITFMEAINGLDIMKAGLSTMSGDTLLETGGMFYLDAQYNGERVMIDPQKPLTVMVPASNADPDMKLYKGSMTDKGVIDWQDPQPLPKTLVPVDITTLDFYPPGYLDKVAELGKDARDKRYTDSLYWSFSGILDQCQPFKDHTWERMVFGGQDTSISEIDKRSFLDTQRGAFLFAQSCASCHKPYLDMTGPALMGARSRWEGRGDIYAWIRNSQAVIKSGNPYAIDLYRKWNKSVMPPQRLNNEEIEAILDYVDKSIWHTYKFCGIDPAKVQAIWNERFNGSNLATREFEERMREIHLTCDDRVLDLYANNLGQTMSHIDSLVVAMGHGAFATFALRNDGKVDMPQHAEVRLKKLYAEWSERHAAASRAALESIRLEEHNAAQTRFQHDEKERSYREEVYLKEFDANLRSAYDQLGYEWPASPPPRAAFAASVSNTGWWNVDKAVAEATNTRTSMDYTDPQTGKTAILTYTPISIELDDRTSFDDIRVYLIPRELNSYQRIVEVDGLFSERLNALFEYDLITLGRKHGQQYAGYERNVNEKDRVMISLEPTDDEILQQILSGSGKGIVSEIVDQAHYLAWLERDLIRQQTQAANQAVSEVLIPVVFPCSGEGWRGEGWEIPQ